jgi:hypothetical protein
LIGQPLGAEQPAIFAEKTGDATESGAESGAFNADSAILADPDLARIVAVWPSLAPELKRRVMALLH